MKTQIDIENWARRDHFRFFRSFDEPFFGLVASVDAAAAKRRAKALGASFYLFYLHRSLVAANQIDAFRLRIEGEEIFLHDAVHASPTVNRADGTFGFSYMSFEPDFEAFQKKAKAEIERVRASSGLELAGADRTNIIHYSAMPWVHFTALSHARSFRFADSAPKITFGKTEPKGKKFLLPVALHLHHALADGSDAGRFFELFQSILNEND